MARARNIKPGFFTNDELPTVQPIGRLLFIGLWTIADREGRLEDRPRRIKAEILPYDDADVDRLLFDLYATRFITRYEVGGSRYIQITNFAKHQNPHVKELPSTIPAPDESDANPVLIPETPERAGLIPSYGFLIPDSPKRATKVAMDGFENFYAAYPKKRNRGDAEKAWAKLKPDALLQNRILEAVEVAKRRDDWRKEGGQYVPYPASWLSAKGWDDEDEQQFSEAWREAR